MQLALLYPADGKSGDPRRRFTEPLAVERTRDLEVVGTVVLVRDNLLNLGSAVGGDLGGNLAHYAGSPELNAIIFDSHPGLHFAPGNQVAKTDPAKLSKV